LTDPQLEGSAAESSGAENSEAVAIRVRVIVTGQVQGVWFRDTCRDQARRENVGGFARNRADGTVEVELEGMEPAVERVIAWCRVGPARARVDSVAVERIAAVGEPGFRIR
jgi:acylphosphatase